jgi:very-short-patch-repair endonuclease
MSPLSVSLFLEAENYNFDIIIFDEASQVCTEDAIGAIMRGSQVIIAGDSKQLPPTSFFAAITSDKYFDTADYNEDEYDDSDAYESILDEAVTVLPERTLKWHYRSRHEELIAFSNAKIYNYNLITFPSHIDRLPGNGVEYIYVPNGVYDRGGKKYNINEAKKVADLVFEHIKKYPNRSLGVVTFSEAQQQSVESAIRQLRLQNQQFESYFREDIEEAFFVKNLENVQGDERDTIIFSIGYAKDHNGIMYMNFGPLSKSGGYRRLNVAITRAKFNVKLVGSIHPTDIRLENTNSEGVKLLRSYIEFAINGTSVLQRELNYSNIVEVDSPFEESVYDFLVKHNYKVVTQVGCSGYRIDLAVKHPTLDNRFVLGIECDGATYHSARTARERDRLRQTVLEDIGWRIYRIWSTDWIKDPITEGQKLLETVEKAISQYMSDDFFFENHNDNQEIIISQEEFLTIDASVEQSSGDEDIDDNPYGFDYYEETTVYEIDRHPDDAIYLAKAINHVVQKEYPIHFELLCKRIAPLFGNQKATVKVRNSAEFVINNKLNNSVERRGDFCWLKGTNKVPVRIPQACDTGRKINYLSIDELAEAMFQIANKSIGITQEDLYVSTARVFGFNRTGGNISNAMQKACEYLIETGRVKNSGGKIIV